MPLANWATISQQLAIKFGDRFKLGTVVKRIKLYNELIANAI